ncbi:blr5118 [Bradyrhizobium diazoefficiens USDA 110]|uniref:Blr5118 protein n=1 Tax=Bradyrhizobium diazoefficiens (strain JCM 10833 / BCRC 13528 / IAM 13628 / NBRC 14792 / USDA 110) TaxID=224911 RepID=Q89K01_BRADU|nr:hypothetical protein CO678_22325 [Bradyrhizobium diazoefficiens]QBP23901.1 hypothetical protein Bdiaspc4_26905 [Bradyrhizobium diazoefficiens]BAC50383.1 blr5118 [Bradyrhizobium diazoefficiens USDA 110]
MSRARGNARALWRWVRSARLKLTRYSFSTPSLRGARDKIAEQSSRSAEAPWIASRSLSSRRALRGRWLAMTARAFRVLHGCHLGRGPPADIRSTLGCPIRNVCYRALTGTAFPSRIWEGHGHEIVIKPCRAFNCRCLVNRPGVRSRRVADPDRLRRHTSPRHGRCTEAIDEATGAAAGGKHRGIIAPDCVNRSNVIVNRTDAFVCTGFSDGEASLEKVASSCNGGCASSFPHGKEPWIGCSESGGNIDYGPFSPTCRDTITHTSYENCVETKVFLGENRNRAHWFCSSLAAGNRFKVAELKRSGRPR